MTPVSDETASVAVRHGFRSLSPAAQLLVINEFGIDVGFFMVLPFLAAYLTDDLGYGTAVVGLVLGLRTLSQQGMFLLGGSAAADPALRWTPAAALVAIGMAGASGIAIMQRRGLLAVAAG